MSVQWYWANDSATGEQDVWEKYDDATSQRIEKAYQKSQKTTKVDDERFIDFAAMTQRRRDDPSKQRTVKRVVGGGSPDDDNDDDDNPQPNTSAAAAAAAAAATSTRRVTRKKTVEPGEDGKNLDTDDSDVEVEWFWAGDSKGGHQDIRVPYSGAMNTKIEGSFKSKQKVLKLDDERYLDFKEMTQRRYDDKNKRRMLFRVKKRVQKTPSSTPAPVVAAPTSLSAPPPTILPAAPAPVPVPVPAPAPVSAPASVADPTPQAAPPPTGAPLTKQPSSNDDGSCSDSDSGTQVGQKRKRVTRSASAGLKRAKVDDDGSCTEDESDPKASTSTFSTTTTTTAAATPAQNSGEIISWFWAGDSPKGGHQDIWVQYDTAMTNKLEAAFQAGAADVKVDDQRFVDLKSKPYLQRRYDDPMKRRTVKRVVKKKPAATTSAPTATPATTTTTTAGTAPAGAAPAPTDEPKKELKLNIEVDDANTKITKITQAKDDLSSSSSGESINLKKLGHHALPGCPPTWGDEEGMDYYELNVDPNSDEFKKVSAMITDTVEQLHCNNPSNHKITFSKLQVTRVVRVQNPALWLRYHNRRQKIIQSKKGLVPFTKVATGPSSEPAANEFFLFHGLNHAFLDEITQFGFDPRHCSLDGMFGAGLYFADNSSKSNQYTHSGACKLTGMAGLGKQNSCACKKTDEACMLLCRTTLGEPFVEVKFQGNGVGQFWNGRRKEPTKADGSIFNSVVGESKKNVPGAYLQFREYIVYESSQVYPEYKVYYKRV